MNNIRRMAIKSGWRDPSLALWHFIRCNKNLHPPLYNKGNLFPQFCSGNVALYQSRFPILVLYVINQQLKGENVQFLSMVQSGGAKDSIVSCIFLGNRAIAPPPHPPKIASTIIALQITSPQTTGAQTIVPQNNCLLINNYCQVLNVSPHCINSGLSEKGWELVPSPSPPLPLPFLDMQPHQTGKFKMR